MVAALLWIDNNQVGPADDFSSLTSDDLWSARTTRSRLCPSLYASILKSVQRILGRWQCEKAGDAERRDRLVQQHLWTPIDMDADGRRTGIPGAWHGLANITAACHWLC